MNKKGIELATSNLVSIIIGVIVVGLGLVFVFRFVIPTSNQVLVDEFPDNAKIQIDECLKKKNRLCLADVTKKAKLDETVYFPLSVNNIHREDRTFSIKVEHIKSVDLENHPLENPVDVSDWTFTSTELQIDAGSHEYYPLPMKVPKDIVRGKYFFSVVVCDDTQTNPNSKKCEGPTTSLYSSRGISIILD